jgi:cysteine synthase
MIERPKAIAQHDTYYSTDQFNNTDAYVGYKALGLELVDQILNGIDGFCAAVGTVDMVMGTWKLVILFGVTLDPL